MYTTKNYEINVKNINHIWIFWYYYNKHSKNNQIDIKSFNGNTIKVKSLFSVDKTPSLVFYNKNNQYKFKCFSTNISGSGIDFLMHLYNKPYNEIYKIILKDYNSKKEFVQFEEIKKNDFQIIDYKISKFTNFDKSFWNQFCINSNILKKYNVKSLINIIYTKNLKKIEKPLINVYGYFTKNNELYKIYQPFNKDCKFLNLNNKIIQGEDQLENHDNLLITSSLKDIMGIKTIEKLKLDIIAPSSENTILDYNKILEYKKKYTNILTLMDNDKAGFSAALKYKNLFNIDYIFMKYKDPTDTIKKIGYSNFVYNIIPKINNKINVGL